MIEMLSFRTSNWEQLDIKEIVNYDTIIPDSDFSLGEATIIFKGEVVISAT